MLFVLFENIKNLQYINYMDVIKKKTIRETNFNRIK